MLGSLTVISLLETITIRKVTPRGMPVLSYSHPAPRRVSRWRGGVSRWVRSSDSFSLTSHPLETLVDGLNLLCDEMNLAPHC